MTLHYGKVSVTRRTFTSGAKISTFVAILGLFDQVDMILDVYFAQFPFLSHREILEKASRQHAGNVRLGSYSALG